MYYIILNINRYKILDESEFDKSKVHIFNKDEWIYYPSRGLCTGPFLHPQEAKFYLLKRRQRQLQNHLRNTGPWYSTDEEWTENDKKSFKIEIEKIQKILDKIQNRYPHMFI